MTEPRSPLREYRTILGVSQAAFAQELGVSLRAYEEMESGRTQTRAVNVQAARYVLLRFCAMNKIAFTDLPHDLQETVEDIVRHRAYQLSRIVG